MFPASTYQARRSALRSRMSGGLVLMPGNQDSPMNYRDNAYPFRQDSSFLYFFGHDQPGLVGLMDLDSGEDWLIGAEPTIDEVVWSGPLPSLTERASQSGIVRTQSRQALVTLLESAICGKREIHFLKPYRADAVVELASWLKIPVAAAATRYSVPLTQAVIALRQCKTAQEIAEIEAALAVTAEMHHAAMRASRPGVVEREVVGIMEGIMRRQDWQLAYPVIFSKRGEVLHNHGHDLTLEKGDLVVNDSGCASALGYASDITRTIPVGGKFVGVQRLLYGLVLEAHQRTIAALRPGLPYVNAHKLACAVLVEGLKSLGCFHGDTDEIVESGAYAIVFQCGVGHQLGLDVHDMESLGEDHVGYDEHFVRSKLFGLSYLRLAKPLQPGFVVTVEPGIYIVPALLDLWRKERRHVEFINYDALDRLRRLGGIRIEDDVLVTQSGSRILGPRIARTADEVEAVMAG